MSSRKYPRIGEQRCRSHKWDKQRAKNPNNKDLIRPCVVCAAPSSHEVFIEVDWFRGNDDGPYRTCREHRNDLDAILKATAEVTP